MPTSQNISQETIHQFYIIAYFYDRGTLPTTEQLGLLTHLNYAFITPRHDGTLNPLDYPDNLRQLVEAAHTKGVKVLLSVGGWGWDEQFESLAGDPDLRQVFIQGLIQVMADYDLDGFDIDWEYPDAGQSAQNYVALMKELREALPLEKLLTAAVPGGDWGGDGYPYESFQYCDFLNIMVYDGPPPHHSTYAYAVESLDYWQGRGLEKAKTVLGMPFYGKNEESNVWVTYNNLIAADPANAMHEQADYNGVSVYYNGIPMTHKKTTLAMARARGMMFWELGGDTSGEYSLLKAIYDTDHQP